MKLFIGLQPYTEAHLSYETDECVEKGCEYLNIDYISTLPHEYILLIRRKTRGFGVPFRDENNLSSDCFKFQFKLNICFCGKFYKCKDTKIYFFKGIQIRGIINFRNGFKNSSVYPFLDIHISFHN